jgi:hypothetical protein
MAKIPGALPDMGAITTRAALRNSDVYERFLKLVQGPLYSTDMFSAKELRLLENAFVADGVKIDQHCKHCGRDSVFRSQKLNQAYNVDVPETSVTSRVGVRTFDRVKITSDTRSFLNDLVISCVRDENHTVKYVFQINSVFSKSDSDSELSKRTECAIGKIGQFPTYADLQRPVFSHLSSFLDQIDRIELNKAVGLAAHDSAIGAFVYLRRVFERLIEKKHLEAVKLDDWDEDEYQKTPRMDDKVQLLRPFLPDLLVENRKIYSVLSVGIHSLTDELCAAVFERVLNGVRIMLEDEHAKRQQNEVRKNLGSSLDTVQKMIETALNKDDK